MSESIVRSRIFSSACALSGKLKQIEVRVRHYDIFSLPTDPAFHIDIAVSSTGSTWIDVEADASLLFPAHATPPASHVEGNGHQVTNFEVFDVLSFFNDLACNLVAEYQALWGGRAPPNHMLI